MFLVSKKWLLTRLFDLRNSKIRSINSTEWVYGKVHQSYLIINWVRELPLHIADVEPCFSNPTFIDLEILLCGKRKREEWNLVAIQLQAISYHTPHTD